MWKTIKQLSSALTAAAVILGAAGYVAKPHAEQFINQSVQGKVEQLELNIKALEDSLVEMKELSDHIKMEQTTSSAQQRVIIRLLQKQFDTPIPMPTPN